MLIVNRYDNLGNRLFAFDNRLVGRISEQLLRDNDQITMKVADLSES